MKVLIIGPFPSPLTGNSLANQIVFDTLPLIYSNVSVEKINTSFAYFQEDLGKPSFFKIIHYLKQYLEIVKIFRCDKLYYTSGQTFYGVLKYFPYLIVGKLLNKEIIVHIHGNFLHKEFNNLTGIKRTIFKKTLQLCDKGIALSSSLKKNLTPFLQERNIFELENFVEDFVFSKKIKKRFDKLRIIYLSNLMTEKGIFYLLDSFKILHEKNVKFEAKIAGAIDQLVECRIKNKLNDMPKCVCYLGLVHGKEKKQLLDWGNVFVFPSYLMEGQPISILEAMATGNIILTTNQAGINDIFEQKVNGFYIKKKSSISIANTLQMISENINTYTDISEGNLREASEKYTVTNFINKLYLFLNA